MPSWSRSSPRGRARFQVSISSLSYRPPCLSSQKTSACPGSYCRVADACFSLPGKRNMQLGPGRANKGIPECRLLSGAWICGCEKSGLWARDIEILRPHSVRAIAVEQLPSNASSKGCSGSSIAQAVSMRLPGPWSPDAACCLPEIRGSRTPSLLRGRWPCGCPRLRYIPPAGFRERQRNRRRA